MGGQAIHMASGEPHNVKSRQGLSHPITASKGTSVGGLHPPPITRWWEVHNSLVVEYTMEDPGTPLWWPHPARPLDSPPESYEPPTTW